MRTTFGLALAVMAFGGTMGCVVVTTSNDCSNGFEDGLETDVDCGGGVCAACADGRHCWDGSDCEGGICSAGRCTSTRFAGGDVPTNVTVYHADPGQGVNVAPGQQAGYGITASAGGSYRLFCTGDAKQSGAYHEFWGSVWTTGTFSDPVPGCNGKCPLEADDYLSGVINVTSGQRVDFDFYATTGLDGFDVVGTDPVYFDLWIDGNHYPDLAFYVDAATGNVATVASIPFGLTTQ